MWRSSESWVQASATQLLSLVVYVAVVQAALRGQEHEDSCDPDVNSHCRYVCSFGKDATDCGYRARSDDTDDGQGMEMICGGNAEICCPGSTCSTPSLRCQEGFCRSCGSLNEMACTGMSVPLHSPDQTFMWVRGKSTCQHIIDSFD